MEQLTKLDPYYADKTYIFFPSVLSVLQTFQIKVSKNNGALKFKLVWNWSFFAKIKYTKNFVRNKIFDQQIQN